MESIQAHKGQINSTVTCVVDNFDGSSQTVTFDPSLISADATIDENNSRIRANFQKQGVTIETEIHTLTGGVGDILVTKINGVRSTDVYYWRMLYNEGHAGIGLVSLLKSVERGLISFRYVKR